MRGKAEIAERLKEVSDILAQVQGLRAEFSPELSRTSERR